MGDGYKTIEEGLCGRTTVWDDPLSEYRNGKDYLVPCLETHAPIDLVVLMLGSNDLKMRFSVPQLNIADGVGILVDIIQKSDTGVKGRPPQVLLIAPPPISPVPGSDIDEEFQGGVEKSLKFTEYYCRVSDEYNCLYLDSSQVISPSVVDGLHFDPGAHEALAAAIAMRVPEIIG